MSIEPIVSFLRNECVENEHLYAIIDTWIYKEFLDIIDIEGEENISILLKEPYLQGYEEAAPYLIEMDIDTPLFLELLEASLKENWMSFVISSKTLESLARELREMIVPFSQHHEQEIIFRFYDPRNLSNYIHIHDEDELEEFYDDIGGRMLTIDVDDASVLYRYDRKGIEMIDLKEKA
jgi:hypothetical protein